MVSPDENGMMSKIKAAIANACGITIEFFFTKLLLLLGSVQQ